MTIREQHIDYCKTHNSKISFNDFKKVLKLLNEKTINRVNNNQSFNMGFLLGSFHVIQKERKIKYSELNNTYYTSINWPKSKANKKKLIEEGKLPLAYIKDENNKIIGSNGGEKWQVFNTSEFVYHYYWNRYRTEADKTKFKEGVFFPLKRIRNYHLKISRNIYQELYKYAISNKINYINTTLK